MSDTNTQLTAPKAPSSGKVLDDRQIKPAPKHRKKGDPYPDMTDWGREALKRINALHKALDGKTLA